MGINGQKDENEEHEQIQFWSLRAFLSFFILAIVIGLAQAGGIGGGPIVSPIMMLLFKYTSRKAVWNTYIMLFGGALGNYLRLSGERVKTNGVPLINYKLILITLPLLLSGAVFGVAAGKSFPKVLITIGLILILSQVLYKIRKSYIKLRKLEDEQAQNILETNSKSSWIELVNIEDDVNVNDLNAAFTIKQKLITVPNEVDVKRDIRAESLQLTSLTTYQIFKNPKLLMLQDFEKQLYPKSIIIQMILQVIVVLSLLLIRGSKDLDSVIGIQYCSLPYQLFNLLIFGVCLISVSYFKSYIIREEKEKEQLGFDFQNEAKMATLFTTTVKASFIAGFLGGFVGLGGGTILNPLWLDLGISSPRAAASSTFCVIFTSIISLFQIMISGGYTIQELLIFGTISCTGSFIVAGILRHLVQKYRRDSIIILVLMGVVVFGLVILPFISVNEIIQDPNESLQFHNFC